jgi:hypothetical protein
MVSPNNRYIPARTMDLVQVDMVGLQPLQARFDGGADIERVQVVLAAPDPVHGRVRASYFKLARDEWLGMMVEDRAIFSS